ncbi:hypothetical protein K504DRAFT_504657 [Pleomassaria siparia CBS 279.74]|uniref:Pyridoxamine 5'-phosphate oxidase putative domain-containing protein n=1 Tax=Pleomassaria siparia CBS 279.74 TaxID=1314801 RepID=A0A6G1K1B9_9PLEO|nr:hypothetical protein K504DRAFT_504657 [Pleomassaria siparia CBS 279.74]
MVKFYPSISEDSVWLATGKHVNFSPKGHPNRSFAVLHVNKVAYLDAMEPSCETTFHVYENCQITVIFCSFNASPKIVISCGKGQTVEKDDKGFEELRTNMSGDVEPGFGVLLIGQSNSDTAGGNKDLETGFTNHDMMGAWSSKVSEKDALLGWQKNCYFQSLDNLIGMRRAR